MKRGEEELNGLEEKWKGGEKEGKGGEEEGNRGKPDPLTPTSVQQHLARMSNFLLLLLFLLSSCSFPSSSLPPFLVLSRACLLLHSLSPLYKKITLPFINTFISPLACLSPLTLSFTPSIEGQDKGRSNRKHTHYTLHTHTHTHTQ